MFECFSRHTATFLIIGDHCTRQCTFCTVRHGPRQTSLDARPDILNHNVETVPRIYPALRPRPGMRVLCNY